MGLRELRALKDDPLEEVDELSGELGGEERLEVAETSSALVLSGKAHSTTWSMSALVWTLSEPSSSF